MLEDRDGAMSEKPQSKDQALEALDFIVNVLKEHEKDLDRLIGELGMVAEQLGDAGELSSKVVKVEERITNLQNQITSLIKHLSIPISEAPSAAGVHKSEVVQPAVMPGRPLILRCKKWDDFQTLAFQAQTLSFVYKEAEKTFQANALKGNQVIVYNGELPTATALLKVWLSRLLEVPEKKILEGVLGFG
jgi:hypothetical protein